MKKHFSFIPLMSLVLPLLFAQSTSLKQFKHWDPEEGAWVEDADAPGTYSKTVTGSATSGNWIMYVKFNPGAWANWHWHRNLQTMYVVSGTMKYEVKPNPEMTLKPALRANIDETVLPVIITEQGENRNQCEEQWNLFGFPHGFACRGT